MGSNRQIAVSSQVTGAAEPYGIEVNFAGTMQNHPTRRLFRTELFMRKGHLTSHLMRVQRQRYLFFL